MLPPPPTIYRRFVQFLRRPQVQIHGRNSVWRSAFAPASPLWNGLEGYSVALSHRTGMLWSWRRRFVIPLFDRDMVSMPRPSWALVPSPEARYRLRDKAQFERYARLHGLSSFLPATFDPEAPAVFPAVLKRTDRNSAEGVVVVESLAELRAHRASPLFAGHPVPLQEFIDETTDYVTHLVAVDGAIVWQVTTRSASPTAAPCAVLETTEASALQRSRPRKSRCSNNSCARWRSAGRPMSTSAAGRTARSPSSKSTRASASRCCVPNTWRTCTPRSARSSPMRRCTAEGVADQ
jgi:hypothetical protein